MPQLQYGDNLNYPNYGMDPANLNAGMDPYVPEAAQGQPTYGESGFPSSMPLGPNNNNLNYPTYGQDLGLPQYSPEQSGVGTASQTLDTAGNVGLMSGNPYGMVAGGVAKLASQGLGLYDKMNQRDQAKKNYEMMLAEYERRQAIEQADRQREQGRQERQEGYFGADYAFNLGQKLADQYTGQRVGGQNPTFTGGR
jgi:hypothetical protein